MNESQMGWKGRVRSAKHRARLAGGLGLASAGLWSQAGKPEKRSGLSNAAQALTVTGPGCPLAAICGTAATERWDLALFPRDARCTSLP